jgi:hypothetical protein
MVRRLRRLTQITGGLFCSSGVLSCMPAPRAAPHAEGSPRARYPASPRRPQITRIHNQHNQRTFCTSFYNGPQINTDYARHVLLIRRTFG